MRTIHFNGEFWYEDRSPLIWRFMKWFCWIGGYFQFRPIKCWDVTPVSFLGHRITLYGWGWEIKTPWGWLVYSKGGGCRRCYISKTATPDGAHTWFFGEPHEVVESVEAWKDDLRLRKATRGMGT